MPVIKNPSFETIEPNANPGLADDWTFESFNAVQWMWTPYQAHSVDPNYWAVERFEGGWDNDDGYFSAFVPTDLEFFDVDGGNAETFEYFVAGVLMSWIDEFESTDLELADYAILSGGAPAAVTYEAFDSDWNNDEPPEGTYYFILNSWTDGAAPIYVDSADALPKYQLSGITLIFRLAVGLVVTDVTVPLTPGTYTVADMVTELNTKTQAALIGAGFAASTLAWTAAPGGGVRVTLSGANTSFMPIPSSSGGAFDDLGYDLNDRATSHWRPKESEQYTYATYDSGANAYENFERGFSNDLFDYLWHGESWVDSTSKATLWAVTLNVNDRIDILIDDDIGGQALLQVTIAAGLYNLAQIVTELDTKIDAALVAAGAPWNAGHMSVIASPNLDIRIINTAGAASGSTWFQKPATQEGWTDLGFELTSDLPDRKSRRVDERYPVVELWDVALYDAGFNSYEGFEAGGGWPALT